MERNIKSYSELCLLDTFEDRYEYLRLDGVVAKETFGFERYLNQTLYRSREWKRLRDEIIIRDEGCDLGINDRPIFKRIMIHHINPITIEDVERRASCIFDPENLIATSHNTHNAIHYGDDSILTLIPKERRRGDTCPWIAS